MLKKRVIPCLLLKDFILVKPVSFGAVRNVGSPISVARVFNSRHVDELMLLDITATQEKQGPNVDIITDVTDECFMPLTVGGGISEIGHIRQLLKAGADKVSINTAAIESPDLIKKGAKTFGSQCIVISIDAKSDGKGGYRVYSHSGKKATNLEVCDWAKKVEELGAGEILLTSIDRDGTKQGYDIDLIRRVSDAVDIPVIASGGVGKLQDFADGVIKGHASAVAAASIFLFTQYTPLNAKKHMREEGIDVRLWE